MKDSSLNEDVLVLAPNCRLDRRCQHAAFRWSDLQHSDPPQRLEPDPEKSLNRSRKQVRLLGVEESGRQPLTKPLVATPIKGVELVPATGQLHWKAAVMMPPCVKMKKAAHTLRKAADEAAQEFPAGEPSAGEERRPVRRAKVAASAAIAASADRGNDDDDVVAIVARLPAKPATVKPSRPLRKAAPPSAPAAGPLVPAPPSLTAAMKKKPGRLPKGGMAPARTASLAASVAAVRAVAGEAVPSPRINVVSLLSFR